MTTEQIASTYEGETTALYESTTFSTEDATTTTAPELIVTSTTASIPEEKLNVGLIVGLSVGIPCGIAVIVAVIIAIIYFKKGKDYLCKRRKSNPTNAYEPTIFTVSRNANQHSTPIYENVFRSRTDEAIYMNEEDNTYDTTMPGS